MVIANNSASEEPDIMVTSFDANMELQSEVSDDTGEMGNGELNYENRGSSRRSYRSESGPVRETASRTYSHPPPKPIRGIHSVTSLEKLNSQSHDYDSAAAARPLRDSECSSVRHSVCSSVRHFDSASQRGGETGSVRSFSRRGEPNVKEGRRHTTNVGPGMPPQLAPRPAKLVSLESKRINFADS